MLCEPTGSSLLGPYGWKEEKKKTLVEISSGDDNLYEVLFKRSTRKGGDHRARVQARVNIDRDGVYNVITLL